MIFLKKKGIKLSEYNLFTMINLAHHNHVTRVNSVWSYSILCFFFCCFSFFFFAVVFLVFFRSFLVFEKISTIWPLLRSSGVSNFSQPLVLKKEIMIMTMKFHYFKNATFFSLLRDQYSLQAIWTRLTDTRQRVLMGFNTWPDDLSKPFLVVLIVTSGLLNLPQATGMNCNTKLTSK